VAVLVPTTVLAAQHYRTFRERFADYPVEIDAISRFRTAREQKDIIARAAEGRIDVLIGTHRLLSKDVRFAELGLVVVDEEQRFGVQHKEQFKRLRASVDVLTMTATPIPRTLHMALLGLRDISSLTTPPLDRRAIYTEVTHYDDELVRAVILRELNREGQVFFVHNRVMDINSLAEHLRATVPEARIDVGHGQMAEGELERTMVRFVRGETDVLVCTTIIESGLDIPRANTLVVTRADLLGLAQLYQIRGRVGRSKLRAYAYITTPPRKPLTPQAERRLKVLASLDTLGAGFQLASHDLDIRGAGNLLGEEQSGHVKEVGFELYQEMLEEAIARIRSGESGAAVEEDETWAPQINLGVPVLIPESYVPDLEVRLGLYRRLSGLSTRQELEGFAAELHDRFGKPPAEVETLLKVVRIKTMCRKAGIARLDGGPKGATIQFRHDRFANPAGLVEFLNAQKGLAKVKDNRLVVRRDWRDDEDRVKGAFAVARDLAQVAVAEAA
jgi:transcription-repair coupling factor (superfamily II helicase)